MLLAIPVVARAANDEPVGIPMQGVQLDPSLYGDSVIESMAERRF